MNSIAFNCENEKHFSTRIREFFRRYRIGGILKKSNAYKEQGVSVVALIEYLFCLVFRNRSMFLDMGSKSAPAFAKDTVYRLRNSTRIDWRRFTTLLSARIIGDTLEPLTSEKRKMPLSSTTPFSSETAPKRWSFWQRSTTMRSTAIPGASGC